MKITVFTSNQPRHLSLAKELSKIATGIYLITETNTLFPGKMNGYIVKSKTMEGYFDQVKKAEKKIFGDIQFLGSNIKQMAISGGELSHLHEGQLREGLSSDLYIVFGASYIKGWLVDFLIKNRALNIHMGLSPYYRGSACNFWALYDKNVSYVGSTIHMLSKGLDSGDILFHCVPEQIENDSSFDFTMRSVKVAHESLAQKIEDDSIFSTKPLSQDKNLEIRYSRKSEFTDEIVEEFLNRKGYFLDTQGTVRPNLIL